MEFSSSQILHLMLDVCWLSILLLIGKLLRIQVGLFRKLFLPASIIAGFLGLMLGPYGLGKTNLQIIPQDMLNNWSMFPGQLINVVFACLFLGVSIPTLRKIWNEAAPQFCYGWVVGMGQYVIGIGITLAVLQPVFGVPLIFGCLLEIGFAGGHGTAAGLQDTFTQLGFSAGKELSVMSATVGIVSAALFGMILINMAVRRGFTHITGLQKNKALQDDRGLLPHGSRDAGSVITIAPAALEPFAFHAAFVAGAILIGWYMLSGIQWLSAATTPDLFQSFPLFPMAMVGGIIIQIIASKLNIARYLDRKSFERILGFALDFLVVSAIASIRLEVFFSYFWPFVILMIAGLLWVIGTTWFLARYMLPDVWFERAIVEYGMQTGVTATGLLLLRVVDPKFETPAAESFGFKMMLSAIFLGGGFITAIAPVLVVNYNVAVLLTGGVVTIAIALAIAMYSGWMHRSAA